MFSLGSTNSQQAVRLLGFPSSSLSLLSVFLLALFSSMLLHLDTLADFFWAQDTNYFRFACGFTVGLILDFAFSSTFAFAFTFNAVFI